MPKKTISVSFLWISEPPDIDTKIVIPNLMHRRPRNRILADVTSPSRKCTRNCINSHGESSITEWVQTVKMARCTDLGHFLPKIPRRGVDNVFWFGAGQRRGQKWVSWKLPLYWSDDGWPFYIILSMKRKLIEFFIKIYIKKIVVNLDVNFWSVNIKIWWYKNRPLCLFSWPWK